MAAQDIYLLLNKSRLAKYALLPSSVLSLISFSNVLMLLQIDLKYLIDLTCSISLLLILKPDKLCVSFFVSQIFYFLDINNCAKKSCVPWAQ